MKDHTLEKAQATQTPKNEEKVLMRFAQAVCDVALGTALLSYTMLPATLIYGAIPLEALSKAIVTEHISLSRQAYVDIIWAVGFALMISILLTVATALMLGVVYPLTRTRPKTKMVMTHIAVLVFLSGWPLKLFMAINPGNYGIEPSKGTHYFLGYDITVYSSMKWIDALFISPLSIVVLAVFAVTLICAILTRAVTVSEINAQKEAARKKQRAEAEAAKVIDEANKKFPSQ